MEHKERDAGSAAWLTPDEIKDAANKKVVAGQILAKRIAWLASILRIVAIALLCTGILLPALGVWLFEENFGYACWQFIFLGLLSALGFGYCRFILTKYDQGCKEG